MVLRVQYISHVSAGRTSGGVAILLALVTISVLLAAAVLLVREWRRVVRSDAITLVDETERWLREQPPP
jgi:hypothetical protein